jgi:hypothetical protein
MGFRIVQRARGLRHDGLAGRSQRSFVLITATAVAVSLGLSMDVAAGVRPADSGQSRVVTVDVERQPNGARTGMDRDGVSRFCVDENGDPIPCTTAKRQVKKFKKGKIGRTHGVKFPKAVKRKIHRKWARHHRALGDPWDAWWGGFKDSITCFGSHSWQCKSGDSGYTDAEAREDLKDTGKVVIACGGAAVLGGIKGGGWWGAGRGASICLWAKLIDLW